MEIGFDTRSLSDSKTRGGPLMNTPYGGWLNIGFHNNFASNTQFGAFYAVSKDELGGFNYNIETNLSSRIGDHLQLSVEPNYSYSISKRQYVTTLDNGPEETYGKRYVFSSIKRN